MGFGQLPVKFLDLAFGLLIFGVMLGFFGAPGLQDVSLVSLIYTTTLWFHNVRAWRSSLWGFKYFSRFPFWFWTCDAQTDMFAAVGWLKVLSRFVVVGVLCSCIASL